MLEKASLSIIIIAASATNDIIATTNPLALFFASYAEIAAHITTPGIIHNNVATITDMTTLVVKVFLLVMGYHCNIMTLHMHNCGVPFGQFLFKLIDASSEEEVIFRQDYQEYLEQE